jgi:aminopeptidase N
MAKQTEEETQGAQADSSTAVLRRGSAAKCWMAGGTTALALAISACGVAENMTGSSALAATTYDVESYALVGEYDFSAKQLNAKVTVQFASNAAPPSSVVLDSQVSEINSVTLPSGEALPFAVNASAGTLTVELGRNAVPGAAVVVDYVAKRSVNAGILGLPLSSFDARKGDPSKGRVAYTFSEPQSARQWMPSHDDPSDRALFSADFKVGAGERLIANGALVDESRRGPNGSGRMKYATTYSLPTYLMAFAVGEFEVERQRGPRGLPLSVWHRRGVFADHQKTMRQLTAMIEHFENLIGVQYPFEKYALVLLPEFGGGIEHAGISFQGENNSTQPNNISDLNLSAHELGHQWFGDLVTVETWDDLWLKEGMATVLQEEGVRKLNDEGPARGLDGDKRFVRAGQAIRDLARPPANKYTSGPYSRAGWLLSQIRSVVGEEKFWGTWRTLLQENRFGTLSTARFLAAFGPTLSPDVLAKVQTAIDAKALPSIEVAALDAGGARLTLKDAQGALIVPIEFQWYRGDGTVEKLTLSVGQSLDLVRKSPADFLVVDPEDIHPGLRQFVAAANRPQYFSALSPLLSPTGEASVARFLELKAVHQVSALLEQGLPPMQPQEFQSFLSKLDSNKARLQAIGGACQFAQTDAAGWKPILLPILQRAHFLSSIGEEQGALGTCANLFSPDEIMPWTWFNLTFGLPFPLVDERSVEYLSLIPAKPAEMLKVWSAVARRAYSIRSRETAAFTLLLYGRTPGAIPEAELPDWRKVVAALTASNETINATFAYVSLLRSIPSAVAAENQAGREALAGIIRNGDLSIAHPFSACTAYVLAAGDAVAWQVFVDSVRGAQVDEFTQQIFANPIQACGFGALKISDEGRKAHLGGVDDVTDGPIQRAPTRKR